MKLSTYNRLTALNYSNRGTRRKTLSLAAKDRRTEFARHARLFLREGLLTMPKFSQKYYETMDQLRLDRFGITA